jgi:hypothetical protein
MINIRDGRMQPASVTLVDGASMWKLTFPLWTTSSFLRRFRMLP